MKLKMSLFNKSIIESDLKRFWWFSALYTVILFFVLPLQLMLLVLPLKDDMQKDALMCGLHLTTGHATQYSFDGYNIQALLVCILPVFLACLLFSYLHSTRAATMLHSLPLKRSTLLGSHTVSGFLLILLPVLITAVILMILDLFTGLGEYYSLLNVAEWIGLTLIFNLLFFSITVFVGMFTGNAIAQIIFTYIINVLPICLSMLVAYNIQRLLYGFSMDILSNGWAKMLPVVKVAGVGFREFTPLQGALYLLTAIVFLGAAGLAYNSRKLEAAGNIIAFKVMQPVFKYGFAISLALVGGFVTGYIYHSGKIAFIATCFIFAGIGYWAAQMLLEKTLRVWHAYKGFLVFSAAVILWFAGISADVTGYVKHIPQLSEIKSAYYGSNYTAWQLEKNKRPEDLYFRAEGLFKEEANIKAVMSLHAILAENGSAKLTEDLSENTIARQVGIGYRNGVNEKYIAYILKDGRSIIRKYSVDETSVKKFIVPLYESSEYKEDKYPILDQKTQDIKSIEIGDYRTTKKPLVLSDMKQLQSFINVMQSELIDSNYEEITDSEETYVYIRITDGNDFREYYSLRKSYSKLYSWMKENGYYDSTILLPEEIDHVTVQPLKVTWYANGYNYTESGNSTVLEDAALIRELADLCENRMGGKGSGTYLQLEFNGTAVRNFNGFIYTGTPMSEKLREKLEELAANNGTAVK